LLIEKVQKVQKVEKKVEKKRSKFSKLPPKIHRPEWQYTADTTGNVF